MIIDAHAHSCGIFLQTETLIAQLDRLGIERVALCPGLTNDARNETLPHLAKTLPGIDWMQAVNRVIRLISRLRPSSSKLAERNEYVFEMKQKAPGRIIQFYWVDPTRPNAAQDMVNRYHRWRFQGIKLHQCTENFHWGDKALTEIALFAEMNHLPIFIHLYTLEHAREFAAFSQLYPTVRFIVAHLIGLEWFAETPKEFPNIHFEISPYWLISDERILLARKAFGSERILFGSDTPFGSDNQENNIQRVLKLPIPDAEKRMILGENMGRMIQ